MAEMGVGGRINLIFIWKKLWKIKFAHIWYIFSSSAYSATYIWNENILIEKKWDNFLGSEFWIFSFETLIPLLLGQSDVKNKVKEIPRIHHQKMPSHWPGIDWFELSGCHFKESAANHFSWTKCGEFTTGPRPKESCRTKSVPLCSLS